MDIQIPVTITGGGLTGHTDRVVVDSEAATEAIPQEDEGTIDVEGDLGIRSSGRK
ncbi:MAG: hypothetical protein ACFFAY_15015 [Promethearchaeota archaeon]